MSFISGRSHAHLFLPTPMRLSLRKYASLSFLFALFALNALLITSEGAALAATLPAEQANPVEAARLNDIGVALMNQQLTEKAIAKFEEAHAADPSSAIPVMNKGIALVYLRKLPEAEDALKKAAAIDPNNPRTWYSLGILHLGAGDPKLAIADMERVVKIDPSDADARYFLGTFYLSLNDYEHARQEFAEALKLNPVHASAQFGMARALQRMGRTDEAREYLKRFQELTEHKISSPLSAAYGEQGRYATVQDMLAPEAPVGPMIPVSFVAQTIPGPASGPAENAENELGGGACIVDIEGPGHKDLVVMGDGDQAIRAYRNLGNGSFEEIPIAQTGLVASGHGVACAAGDYDNDGLPDLAVAMSDRVILFHNLGKGKFADMTKAVSIQQLNRPAGLTFIDFDHDGDLDLFVTGTALNSSSGPSVLWRNNGNSTFTEWTAQTGLAGEGSTTGVTLSDINNDRAVDLVVTGSAGSPTIFENAREGKFNVVSLSGMTNPASSVGVSVFDFNKDGWMDIVVTHAGA